MSYAAGQDYRNYPYRDHGPPGLEDAQADGTDQTPVALGLPLVLLNGDNLAPDERKLLERELAIALATEGPRLHNSPQVRGTALSSSIF